MDAVTREEVALALAALDGKAMVVCMSRRICVKLYDEIVKLRPAWHSSDDKAGAVKIVMTGSASDKALLRPHIYSAQVKKRLEKRFKNPADPLRLGNTGDNTPAAITVHLVDGDGCTITVAPKGFGSENMSRIQMLKPADGVEGFKKFVVETVKLAGSNPCPPIVLGIGVGGSFDKVAYLAKKALLRPLDIPNPDPYYAQLEQELLAAINELGIGPQGFGGRTTCLGLAIEQMPTHVAGLPVAVNVSCHVTRRASARL